MDHKSKGKKDFKHSIASAKVDSNLSCKPGQPHGAGLNDEATFKSRKESSETCTERARSDVLRCLKTVLQAKMKGRGPGQLATSPEAKPETIDLNLKDSLSHPVEANRKTEPVSYRCSTCLRKFKKFSMLHFHRRRYHLDEGKREGGGSQNLDVEIRLSCVRCRQEFPGFKELTEHARLRPCSGFISAGKSRDGIESGEVSDSVHSNIDPEECRSVPLEERQQHQCAVLNCHSSNTKQANCDETLSEVNETTSLCMDHQGPFQVTEENVDKHCDVASNSKNMTGGEFSAQSAGDFVEETFQTSNMNHSAVGAAPCNQVTSDFSSRRDISLICGPCGQHFPSAEDMKLHKCSRRCETEFPCSICGCKFKLFRSYRLHMKSIHQVESFQCSRCAKVFHSDEDLKAHPCQQNNRRPHLCDICGKSYKTAGYLATHKLSHSGVKPYKCVVCGKAFSQPSNLQTHMRIHRGERPFACKVCGKSFRQLDHLMKHAGVHTKDAPYACETCGKRFRDEDYVKKHMRIHTGAMPFECKDCGMKFRWANRFAAHKCKPESTSDGVSASGKNACTAVSAESQLADSSLEVGQSSQDESVRCSRGELDSELTVSKIAAKSNSVMPDDRSAMQKDRKVNPPTQTSQARKGSAEVDWDLGSKSDLQQTSPDKVDIELQEDSSKTVKYSRAVNNWVCNGPVAGRSIKNEQCDSDSDNDQGKLQIVEDDDEEIRSHEVNGDGSDHDIVVPNLSHDKSKVSCDISSILPHGKKSRLLTQILLSKNVSVDAHCPRNDIVADSKGNEEEVKDSVACGMNSSAGKIAASTHVGGIPEVKGGGGDEQAKARPTSHFVVPAPAVASYPKPRSSAVSCISSEQSVKRGMERGVVYITGGAPSSADKSLSLPLSLGDVCSMQGDQSLIDSLTSDLVKRYINLPPSPPRSSLGTGFVNALPSDNLPLPESIAVGVPFSPALPNSAAPKDRPPLKDWSTVASRAAVPSSSMGPATSDSPQITLTVASVTSLSVSEFEKIPSAASAPIPTPPGERDSKQSSVIEKGASFEGPIPFSASNSDVYTITNDGSHRLHQTVKTLRSLAGDALLPSPQTSFPLPHDSHPSSLSDRQTVEPAFLANPSESHSSQTVRPEMITSSAAVPHPDISPSPCPQNISASDAKIPLVPPGIPLNRQKNPTAAIHQMKPTLVSKSEILRRLQPTAPLTSHSHSLPPRQIRSPPPYPGRRKCSSKGARSAVSSQEGRSCGGGVPARAYRNILPRAVTSDLAACLQRPWPAGLEESRIHAVFHSARPPMAHRPVAPQAGLGGPSSLTTVVLSSPAGQPMDLSVPRNSSESENVAAERGRGTTCLSPGKQRVGNAEIEDAVERSVPITSTLSISSASAIGSGTVRDATQNTLSNLIRNNSSVNGTPPGLADSKLPSTENKSLPQTNAPSLHVPHSPFIVSANSKDGEIFTPVVTKKPDQPTMTECVVCGCEFRWLPNKSKCTQCCRKTSPSVGKSHICDICGKVFTQSGNLRTHLRLHAGDKPYECHICHKRFALMKYLNSHVRMHSDEKQFECHVCGKKLRDATYIKHHMRVHTGAKPFKCRSCGKSFRWRSEFRSHRCSPVHLLSKKRGTGTDDCNQSTETDEMLAMQNDNLLTSGDQGCLDIRSEVVLGNPGKEMMFSKLRYKKLPLERKRNARVARELSKVDMVNPDMSRSQTMEGSGVLADKVSPVYTGKESDPNALAQSCMPNLVDLALKVTDATKGNQMAFGLVRIVDEQKGLAEVVWTSSGSQVFPSEPRSEPGPDKSLQEAPVETSTPQTACTARAVDLPTDVLLLQNDYIYGGQEEELGNEDEIKMESTEENEYHSAAALPKDATSNVLLRDERCQSETPSVKEDVSRGDMAQKDRSDDGYDTFDERRQSDCDERVNPLPPTCPEEIHPGAQRSAASVLLGMQSLPLAYRLDLLSSICAKDEKPNDPTRQTAVPPRLSKVAETDCSDDATGCDLAPLNIMVSNILAVRPDIPASTDSTEPSAQVHELTSNHPSKALPAVCQPKQSTLLDSREVGVIRMPVSSLQFPPGAQFVNMSKSCVSVANSQRLLPQTTVSGGRPISHVVLPSKDVGPSQVASSAVHGTLDHAMSSSEHASLSGPEVPRKVLEKSTGKTSETVCQEAPLDRDVCKSLRLKLKRKSSDHDSHEKWEVEGKEVRREEADARPHLSTDCKDRAGDTALVSSGRKDTRGSLMSNTLACNLQDASTHPLPVSPDEKLEEGKDMGNGAEDAETDTLSSATGTSKHAGPGPSSRKRRRKSRFRNYRVKQGDSSKGNNNHGCHVQKKKRRRAEGELLMADTKEILSVMQKHRTEERPCKRVVGKRGRGSLECKVGRSEAHLREHDVGDNRRCPECHKVFSKAGNLAQHMLIHTDKRPFACSVCGLRFRQRHHLTSHLGAHADLKNHECQYCHKNLRDRWYLKQHLRLHNQEKRFKCLERFKAFCETYKCTGAKESVKGAVASSELQDSESKDSSCPSGSLVKVSEELKAHVRFQQKKLPRKKRKKAVKPTKHAQRVDKVKVLMGTLREETFQSKLTEEKDTVSSSSTYQSEVLSLASEASTPMSDTIASSSPTSVPVPVSTERPAVTQRSDDTNCEKGMVQPPVTEQSDISVISSSGSNKKADVEDQPSHGGETLPSISTDKILFVPPNSVVATMQPLPPPPSASSQAQPPRGATMARPKAKPKCRPSPRKPRVRKQAEGKRPDLPLGGPPPLIEAETLYRAQALSRMNQPVDLSLGAPRAASQEDQDRGVEGAGVACRVGEDSSVAARPHDCSAGGAVSRDSVRRLADRCSSETRMINLADFPVGRLNQSEKWQREHVPDNGMETVSSLSSTANMASMPSHPPGLVVSLSQFESDHDVTVNLSNIPRQAPFDHGLSAERFDPPLPLMSPATVISSSQPRFQSEEISNGAPVLNDAAANTERSNVDTAGTAPMSTSSVSFKLPGGPSALPQRRLQGIADSAVAVSHPVTFCTAIPPSHVSMHQTQQPFQIISAAPAHNSNPPARPEFVGQHSSVFLGVPATTGSASAPTNIPQSPLNTWHVPAQGHVYPGPVSLVCSPLVEAEVRPAAREVSDLGSYAHPMQSSAASFDSVQGREASASPGNRDSMSTPHSDDDNATCTSSSSSKSGHPGKRGSPTAGEDAQRVSCVKCDKTFPSKLALRRHMRAHTKPAPYRCPDCDKGFPDSESLKAHQPVCSGFNPRKCPTCGKVFSQTGNCKKHMLIHEDARPYECEQCHKRFRALYHLQCHMITHNDERPYSCELCGKTFRDGSYIKKHMRLHTGELPYKCEYCSESFRWSSVYTKHLNRVHGVSGAKGSDEQVSPPEPQNGQQGDPGS